MITAQLQGNINFCKCLRLMITTTYSTAFCPPPLAKLSTAIAKKTFSRMSDPSVKELDLFASSWDDIYTELGFKVVLEKKDTVTTDKEDDEVHANHHVREDRPAIRHDAVIHHGVPVLSGENLQQTGTHRNPTGHKGELRVGMLINVFVFY